MKIRLRTNIEIEIENCNLYKLTLAFISSLGELFADFVNQAIHHYGELYKKDGRLKVLLGLPEEVIINWKSRKGTKCSVFYTLFGRVELDNPIVEVIENGVKRRVYIIRPLLGVARRHLIPSFMKRMIGIMGGLSSYRVVLQIMKLLGWCKHSLSTIKKSVQMVSESLRFDIGDEQEIEADGTGVKTKGSGKRGSEIKVVTQRKKGGGLRILGVKVGGYHQKDQWVALFGELNEKINQLSTPIKCMLYGDGDESMLNAWKEQMGIWNKGIQRCLWHIPRQIKYTLWSDDVPKAARKVFLEKVYSITLLNPKIEASEMSAYIQKKLQRLDDFLEYCKTHPDYELSSTITFLTNARADLYSHLESGGQTTDNHCTSLTERMMRTIKQRTKIGKWTRTGVEAVVKVRLSFYYGELKDCTGLLGQVE